MANSPRIQPQWEDDCGKRTTPDYHHPRINAHSDKDSSDPIPYGYGNATLVTAAETPTEEACVPAAQFRWLIHHVLPGEILSYYSERADVPFQEIITVNCLQHGAILSVGQRLHIARPLATVTPTPGPTDTPEIVNGGGGGIPDPKPTTTPRPSSTPGPGPGGQNKSAPQCCK
jgi:hypothetical protein